MCAPGATSDLPPASAHGSRHEGALAPTRTRVVIDVLDERDGSALTFEQVAVECSIDNPALARMHDLYTMNEYLVRRYA